VESTNTGKSKTFIKVAGFLTVIVCLLLFFVYHGLYRIPLSSLVRDDLPMLDLDLRFIDLNGDAIPADITRLAGKTTVPEKPAVPETEICPEIQGGDIAGGSLGETDDETLKNCPKTATWYVKLHPIGVSFSFADSARLFSFFETNAAFKELWQSRFVQGTLYEPLHSANVRAEDLGLQELEGSFLTTLVKESLAAHARLDYDIVHGREGFVYSFIRGECPYAAKALPVIARVLARSGYTTKKLKDPILEMRIGLQRIFIAEYESRIFFANGLEALLNVLESSQHPEQQSRSAPVMLTVEGEAFIDKFLQMMTGEPSFRINLGFSLDQKSADFLSFPAGKYSKHLRPKIFKGVFASIPQDVFSAAVTSFYLPADMTPEEWQRLAEDGPAKEPVKSPEEGGLAFIWDLSSESNQITEMGVVIATQNSPHKADQMAGYFTDSDLTAQCGGGTVFLAATSEMLLTRMKESCERQSLSMLDWERGAHADELGSKQLLFFMNPGTGMRELFLAGGAGTDEQETTPEPWKVQYEQAKAVMRQDGEKIFSALPIFTYSGNVPSTAKEVRLSGVKVRQGTVQ
jgi:hypothetical protein